MDKYMIQMFSFSDNISQFPKFKGYSYLLYNLEQINKGDRIEDCQ